MQNKLYYQQQFDTYSTKIDLLSKQIKNYSRVRLIWFLMGAVAVYFISDLGTIWTLSTLAFFLIFFLFIAVKHNRIIETKREFLVFKRVFTDELEALKGNYSPFDGGVDLIDFQHPYAVDLDLFGNSSIFKMLNRSFSNAGKGFLSQFLTRIEQKSESIRNRQNAVKELASLPDWLTTFRALGMMAFSKESSSAPDPNQLAEDLKTWIHKETLSDTKILKIAQYVLPALSIVFVGLFASAQISSNSFLFYMMLSLGFTGFYTKKINKQHQELSKQSAQLFRFKNLVSHIENGHFSSSELSAIQSKLVCNGMSASKAFDRLATIMQAFDTRLNVFAWLILNYFLLWDIRQSIRLEKWKKQFSKLPENAFEAIAKTEALSSFATFYYNRVDLIFPSIVDEKYIIEGKGLGHPMIRPNQRVDNDIYFPSAKQFTVITGANMSGKSTYLRTIGVTLVLALAGAPVCAKEFKTSILQPFTSIKTSDSLANNESYFYAELTRLQKIIRALESGKAHFIILDEILKGTNSKDKEKGSKALVKRLINFNASGIIATHDLQLAELANTFPENVKANCFEVEITNNQLVFDYKLRNGISQNLNATFLMEQMGIS
ncbi:MAG: hypothetical protein JW729_09450 [Bacteroidales bacterium]|nr:hypothetical protein [Bacteroidales bacterium]